MSRIEAWGIRGIPEVQADDRLADLIIEGVRRSEQALQDGDIVVVSQKVVSKAEGRIYNPEDLAPSSLARTFAAVRGVSPAHVELILRETARVVRMDLDRGILISETHHGYVCANAGVDRSNVGAGEVYSALPRDPDASARRLKEDLEKTLGIRLGVIISDSFGRPWRQGSIDVAIGVAGLAPLRDHRGSRDRYGYELHSTVVALADEVAAAAELVKGKLEEVPVAVVRGVSFQEAPGSMDEAHRPSEDDLFR